VLIFVHKWDLLTFDPFTFARARTFLSRLTRLLRRDGYSADPLTPLSPDLNLPKFAARAGLGNLSPYGLLVHPKYGPRVILSGVKTDYPYLPEPRWGLPGCNDCMACVKLCPQKPLESGIVNLGECQSCAKCLVVCPTGKGRRVGV
jgi:epoxyqueuosine reductase QueG